MHKIDIEGSAKEGRIAPANSRGQAMGSLNADHPIRRMFAGLTEHTFLNILGMADPQLIDYLSSLLSRFIHLDAIYRLRNAKAGAGRGGGHDA